MIRWAGSPRACDAAAAAAIVAEQRRRVACVAACSSTRRSTRSRARRSRSPTATSSSTATRARRSAARSRAAPAARSSRRRAWRGPGDIRDLERFHTDFHLLDAAAAGFRGGSGQTWEWGLLAGPALEDAADPLGRARPRQPRRGDRRRRPVGGRHRVAGPRASPASRTPRRSARVPRDRRAATRRVAHDGRRAPLRPLRRPVRPRDADARAGRARGGVGRGARRRRLQRRPRSACCATSPAARRRCSRRARLSRGRRPPGLAQARGPQSTPASHKLNNALGQALLARRMGKTRIIAETGAGQHGVAAATACALLGLECIVYMGTEDMRRQQPNVQRMGLLGRARRAGRGGGADAQGGGLGGDPRLGRQRRRHPLHHRLERRPGAVPGDRARPPAGDRRRGARPDPRPGRAAARRAWSPASAAAPTRSGCSSPFVDDAEVALIGVEAAGDGIETGRHGAPLTLGRPRRRAARRLLGDHAGRGRPDPRGALDLRRPRLSRHRAAARPPARHRPRHLRGGHRPPGAGRVPAGGAAGGDHPGARVLPRRRLGARRAAVRARPDLPLGPRRQGPRRGARGRWTRREHRRRADRGRLRGHGRAARR